ncbi:MAG TPA: MFS transporter, partial [Rudaea sp.]
GRKRYVYVPPTPPDPHSLLRVVRSALLARAPGESRPGLAVAAIGVLAALALLASISQLGFVIGVCLSLGALLAFGGIGTSLQLERARGAHPDEAVDGVRIVLRVLIVFALVTPFWSLFDQKASTWVLQGAQMTKPAWFHAAQMQALNPMLVMLIIPFNNLVAFPLLRRIGIEPTALRRMGAGIGLAALAWIVAGMLQLAIDAGDAVSIAWQIVPYAFLTLGEVLVSATGLEFAYSQAPRSMKGAIMSFWMLSVTYGNLWVLLADAGIRNGAVTTWIAGAGFGETAFLMFFFAGFAALAAAAFALYARRYPMQDFYRV